MSRIYLIGLCFFLMSTLFVSNLESAEYRSKARHYRDSYRWDTPSHKRYYHSHQRYYPRHTKHYYDRFRTYTAPD